MRWLYPGATIRIEAPCIASGEQLVVEMRDEEILVVDPDEMVGYTSQEVGGDPSTRPFR